MNIVDNQGYKLSVIAGKPDKYTNSSQIVFYSQVDNNPKEKAFEMILDQWGIDSLIDYLQTHRMKTNLNLFLDDAELI